MKPVEKSSEMVKVLDTISLSMFGKSRSEAIRQNICVNCGGEADIFVDIKSKREFAISGLCQNCQDSLFSEDGPAIRGSIGEP